MAMFRLPRLKANLALVNSKGNPLDYFLRFWNIEVAPRIERQEADQDMILQQLQDVQEQQAQLLATQEQQLVLINEALMLAGIAIAQSGGNSGTATTEIDMTPSAWVLGPVVNLTGVAAGNVTVPGSGLYSKTGTTAFFGDTNGEVRIVEVVGGVDTIIGGPWPFTISRVDPNPAGTVYVGNAAQLNTFTQARTTTGAVSYRIDARMLDGDVNNIDLKLYARRST